MAHQYRTQVASDVIRDGLGVELVDESGDVVAEIFRCDRDHTLILTTFNHEIPLAAIEMLQRRANERLGPFEDGIPLTSANVVAPRTLEPPK
jgi:hypothetical protein